jgi:hypothetical protein
MNDFGMEPFACIGRYVEKEDEYFLAGKRATKECRLEPLGITLYEHLHNEGFSGVNLRILYTLVGGALDKENPEADEFVLNAVRLAMCHGKNTEQIEVCLKQVLGTRWAEYLETACSEYGAILQEGTSAWKEVEGELGEGISDADLNMIHLILGENQRGHIDRDEAKKRLSPISSRYKWDLAEKMIISKAFKKEGDSQ